MSKINIRESQLKKKKSFFLFYVQSESAFKYSAYSYIHGGSSCKLKVFHVNHTFPFIETFDFAFKTIVYAFTIIFIVLSSSGDREKRWKISADNLNTGILCISPYCFTISNTDNTDCLDLFESIFKALNIERYRWPYTTFKSCLRNISISRNWTSKIVKLDFRIKLLSWNKITFPFMLLTNFH